MSHVTTEHSEKSFQQYQISDLQLQGLVDGLVASFKESQRLVDGLLAIADRSRKLALRLQEVQSQELL